MTILCGCNLELIKTAPGLNDLDKLFRHLTASFNYQIFINVSEYTMPSCIV